MPLEPLPAQSPPPRQGVNLPQAGRPVNPGPTVLVGGTLTLNLRCCDGAKFAPYGIGAFDGASLGLQG